MLLFAVLSQALAVVGRDDHQRAAPQPLALEEVEQAAELRVRIRHFSVVGPAPVSLPIGLRRLVGRVGIVEVDPGKEGLRPLLLQPRKRARNHRFGPPLLSLHRRRARGRDAVVVEVEAAVESG